MGRSDSPLRDRVVFVEGAPRSGTTMLVSYIAVHPMIAGTVAESHMFDRGIGALFDNFELDGPYTAYLSSFLTRDELADLGRDVGDRILLAVRDKIKPEAAWVVEKTPAPVAEPRRALARKLECYPDAHFVHIVRDREAVARSLVAAPFNDYDHAQAAERHRTSLEAIRAELGSAERYHEIAYDEVAANPVEAMRGVFGSLGLEAEPATLDAVRSLSGERLSNFNPPAGATRTAADEQAGGADDGLDRPARGPRRRRGRNWRPRRSGRAVTEPSESLAQQLVVAARRGDHDRVRRLTADDFKFGMRSGRGSIEQTGDAARTALVEAIEAMLGTQLMAESWTHGGDGRFTTLLVSGIHGSGARTDAFIGALAGDERLDRVQIIVAGDPSGEPDRPWLPPGERA